MDNILLCSNHIPLVTSIHNTFIEKYMLHANGCYVKVYLYLSKCIQAGEEDLSISSLADQMENTEKDAIKDALLRCRNCKAKAANELGISRTTLYEKMMKYEI